MDANVICKQCGATRETFDDKCTAELLDLCPGFVSIELGQYPDGRNIDPDKLSPEARSVYDALVCERDELPTCVWRDAATPFADNH